MSAGKTLLTLVILQAAFAVRGQVTTGPDGDFGLVFRNLLSYTPSSLGHGGNVRPAFSSVWPALKGAGVGIVTLQLEPNATHLPHWHRGFELLFVINGNLTVGINSFNTTVGTTEYNITNGDAIIVENAAAHYVHNRGPGRSINLSAFSSDNPGTQVSSTTLFAFSDQIVQSAVQTDANTIASLRGTVVSTPGLYDGLDFASQKTSQTGNFTQALGSTTATLSNSSASFNLPTAG